MVKGNDNRRVLVRWDFQGYLTHPNQFEFTWVARTRRPIGPRRDYRVHASGEAGLPRNLACVVCRPGIHGRTITVADCDIGSWPSVATRRDRNGPDVTGS